jgi:hypothetical protein
LDDEAIQAILKYGPIVSVGAGSGYNEWLLQERGGDVLATDAFPATQNPYIFHGSWTDITQMTAQEAAEKYSDRSLFFCWPSYDAPWAAEALRAYQGDTVIYIGEGFGGCTGDDAFHEELETWEEIERLSIPQWEGIYDKLYIYRRNRMFPSTWQTSTPRLRTIARWVNEHTTLSASVEKSRYCTDRTIRIKGRNFRKPGKGRDGNLLRICSGDDLTTLYSQHSADTYRRNKDVLVWLRSYLKDNPSALRSDP